MGLGHWLGMHGMSYRSRSVLTPIGGAGGRYMAPEVLECSVGPPADVWAAGVMAYQLLSGYLPFDDRANPRAPAVSKIWCAGSHAGVSAPLFQAEQLPLVHFYFAPTGQQHFWH